MSTTPEPPERTKPCEHCGHPTAHSIETNDEYSDEPFTEDNLTFRVICDFNDGGCGSSTGYCKTAPEAVKLWNTRISATDSAPGDGWLPIASAPKDGTKVLLYWMDAVPQYEIGWWSCEYLNGKPNSYLGYFWHYKDMRSGGCLTTIEPTHWRTLPPPPQPEKQQ